jgi:hypothetical protein
MAKSASIMASMAKEERKSIMVIIESSSEIMEESINK